MRWAVSVFVAMVLATFSARSASASALLSNVPGAVNYEVVYELDIPNTAAWNNNPIPYAIDNATNVIDGSFPRVAYYLELVSGTATQWVYVSMDTFTTNASMLGVPKVGSGEFYHYGITGPITNANILSNVGTITTGAGIDTINIEFWPSNYGNGNSYGVPGADGGTFDFGDGGANTGSGYGSMQIHNYGAGETLFAYNRWGTSNGEIGIGNQPSGNPDWTFSNNIGSYSKKTLQVLVFRGGVNWTSPGVSNVTMTSADAYATLSVVDESNAVAWVYRDTSDKGEVRAAWAYTNSLGTVPEGLVTAAFPGLQSDTTYWYRFYGTNSTTTNHGWSGAASFNTLSSYDWDGDSDDFWGTAANWAAGNVPDTTGEHARFGGQGAGAVDLNGSSYTIDYVRFSAGNYVLTNSGTAATLTVGGLTNSGGANSLCVGVTVTGTTEVSGGTLTLDPVTEHDSGAITLSGGTLAIKGNAAVLVSDNRLLHRGYHGQTSDSRLDLNDNGGLLVLAPYGTAELTDGPGGRGLDFNDDNDFRNTGAINVWDNYANLFIGYFNPPETGTYGFRNAGDDDRAGIWLDLDRDGVFESSTPGRGSDRGEQLSWEDTGNKQVALTAGHSYLVAFTHMEYGGGSRCDFRFTTPSIGERIVKPSDPAQAGLWTLVHRRLDATNLPPITVTADSTLHVDASAGGCRFGVVVVGAGRLKVTDSHWDTVGHRFANISGGGTFDVTGADLMVETASTIGALAAGAGNVTGAMLTASTLFDIEPSSTVHSELTGAAELHAGDNDNKDGVIELLATNSYTGLTRINRAVLRADEGVGLPTNSPLVFYQNTRDQTCILETSGTFDRDIGTGPGEVRWENRGGGGGFAAYGGDLVVELEGGTNLTWNNADVGFNSVDSLQFGSRSADGMVELKNGIALDGSTRRFQTIDNPSTKADFLRISGNITGGGSAHWLRFHESAGNQFNSGANGGLLIELLGTNTYLHNTVVEECALYAIEGIGLPTNSLLRFEGNGGNREAVLLTTGTLDRDIGGSDGEVHWNGNGGFAARGGRFTVTLEGGAQVDWGDADAGFNGRRLMFNSKYADDMVELVNDIELNNVSRWVYVFDNTDTKMDVGVLSGNITGTRNGDQRLYKQGAGVLWLQGTNSTWGQPMDLDDGVVRLDGIENLSTNTTVIFHQGWNQPGVVECKGSITDWNVGPWDEPKAFSWDSEHGGFAAFGGPLTVSLEGGITLNWGSVDTGFDGKYLQFGSRTANDVVTLVNDIDLGGNRNVVVFDNPDSDADYAVIAGVIAGNHQLYKRGDGLLILTAENTYQQQTRIYDGELRVNGSAVSATTYVSFDPGNTGTLSGTGTVDRVEVRDGGTLAPGASVGTLHTTDQVVMLDGSTYAWEFGASDNDEVAVKGNLELRPGWKLKLLGAGGTPRADEEYDVFTYTGDLVWNAPELDASEMPTEWDASGVRVEYDFATKRVYVTGLSSTLAVANREASNVTPTSAQLNGTLSCSGLVMDVWAYWGESDGGTDAGAWSNSVLVNTYSDVIDQAVSHAAPGLAGNSQYYFTFRATNAANDIWAAPSESFLTPGPPVVGNGDGATNVTAFGTATLRGSFLDHNRGEVTICWGLSDSGTISPADWEHRETLGETDDAAFSAVISGALYPLTYYYRCYATNAYGFDWSDTAASFAMDVKPAGISAPAGPIGYWSFNDSGDIGHDDSENGNDGTPAGNAAYTAGGVFGGALSLDGDDDFLTCGNGVAIANRDFSVSLWTRRNSTGVDYAIGHSDGANNSALHIGFRDADTLTFAFWSDDMNYDNAGVIGDTAGYHHWVCTYDVDSNQQLLYLDGNTSPVDNETRSDDFQGTGDFYIGKRRNDLNGEEYHGLIDEVYVYDRTLSADEAARLYAATNTVEAIGIANGQPTERTLTAARLNATVDITNAVYDVWVYWGTTDGQTNAAGWVSNAFVGTYTNVVETNVSHTIGGLTPASMPFYTFCLSNALDVTWATPSTNVSAVAVPEIDNNGGAIAAIGTAVLRGNLAAGSVADVYVYYGRFDGGTNASAWEGSVLLSDTPQGAFSTDVAAGYGFTYHYRCYATNAAGDDWANATTNFTAEPLLDYYQAGLISGTLSGNMSYAANPVNGDGNAVTNLGPWRATNKTWSNNTTYVYSGEMYFNGNSHFFIESIDDKTWLEIDGAVLINNGTWDDVSNSGSVSKSPGWYDFELRMSNGGGGSGWINRNPGFQYNDNGVTSDAEGDNWYPEDPGDASLFRHLNTSLPGKIVVPVLDNAAVSGVSSNAATPNATLASGTGWVVDVWVHWGTSDGGTNYADWGNHTFVGSYVNHDGAIGHALSGLTGQTDYFYTFQATNALTNLWASPSVSFQTLGASVVVSNNAPVYVGQDTATLSGELASGGAGEATVYWGLDDGGANHTAWANTSYAGTVSMGAFTSSVPLLAGATYHYRCYVTNALGDDWADASTTFTSLQVGVSLNMAIVQDDPGVDPLSIGGCELWLAADDIDGDGDTGDNPAHGYAVDVWCDKSGKGRDATRDGSDPTAYNTNGPNGRPVVTFDGDYLSTSHNFDGLKEYTVLSVARYTGGDNERVISSATRNWLFGFNSSGDERWQAETWIHNAGTANTNWHIHAGHINSDEDPKAGFWKDGVKLLTDGTGSHDTDYTIGRLGLGGYRLNNQESRCEIAEVLIYNRVLSDEELERLGSYLDWKYDLMTAYCDLPSVGVTESQGGLEVTATLSAAAISNVTVNFAFGTNATGYVEGMRGSVFPDGILNNTAIDLDGANYTVSDRRVCTGDKANTILSMDEDPDHNVVALGTIQNWNQFPAFDGNIEYFATAFSGAMIPRASGSYTFRGRCDDVAWMYIDMAGDGVWDNGDRVFTGNTSGNKVLVQGQAYSFIFMHREGTSGQSINWYVTEPGGFEQRVSTDAQPGVWNYQVPTASVSNDYTVSAASIVIPAGSLSSNITLTVIDDLDQEDDEAVTVGIASLVNATNDYPDVVSSVLSSHDPKVIDGGATVVSNRATLNCVLSMGDSADVTFFWGTSDGGTNATAWDKSTAVGVLAEDMPFSVELTGLSWGRRYYYRCHVGNDSNLAEDWTDETSSFQTAIVGTLLMLR